MMFLLKCPNCKNKMKYQSKGMILTGKRKKCVYCGKSYNVREAIVKKISN
ncbi:hypothetical protein ISS05_00510 [Candidatus Woesearchaeota archaeon]|nr:hypothetical protein [Candidatus Woesearchaeota archaeon]